MNQKEYWNKKGLDFPRYDENKDGFQQKIIKLLKDENIINNKTSVLDIGCGTGVYTISLAKECESITALDISSKMLELLEEDSWNYNVNTKIQTICSNWKEFKSTEKYDLVLATLSAAFSDEQDFEKILMYSKKHVCFIDFVDTKGSNFEELLYNIYGIKKVVFKNLENKKSWLKRKNMEFKTIPLTNTYSKLIEIDEAITKIKEILKSSQENIILSEEEIRIVLNPLKIGNKINYVINMKLELLHWRNTS